VSAAGVASLLKVAGFVAFAALAAWGLWTLADLMTSCD
jgi:hypothetical protein